jgi:hypothetical protein
VRSFSTRILIKNGDHFTHFQKLIWTLVKGIKIGVRLEYLLNHLKICGIF